MPWRGGEGGLGRPQDRKAAAGDAGGSLVGRQAGAKRWGFFFLLSELRPRVSGTGKGVI